MEGMLDIIIIGMRIKGHGQLRIAVSHDILQRLRVKSGLLHIVRIMKTHRMQSRPLPRLNTAANRQQKLIWPRR